MSGASTANSNHFTAAWIPPILAYTTASILMTLVNKLVLSGFDYKVPFLMLAVQVYDGGWAMYYSCCCSLLCMTALHCMPCISRAAARRTLLHNVAIASCRYRFIPLSLHLLRSLLFQSTSSVLLLHIFTAFGWAKHRPLNKEDARRWAPVALLMAIMLYTGSKALQYLSVPVFTIFKNLAIILVAYGESRVFGGRVTALMLVSFGMMVCLSFIGSISSLSASDNMHAIDE